MKLRHYEKGDKLNARECLLICVRREGLGDVRLVRYKQAQLPPSLTTEKISFKSVFIGLR